MDVVTTVRRLERERSEQQARDALLARLEEGLGAFRDHPNIAKILQQYIDAKHGKPAWRFKVLLLQCHMRMGNSQKAMSLFGIKGSLLVNCQGLETDLPSLRMVASGEPLCIVFDEISAEQVLANKLVFQAGPWPVTLGQSACGQHAYTLNLCALLMICSCVAARAPARQWSSRQPMARLAVDMHGRVVALQVGLAHRPRP